MPKRILCLIFVIAASVLVLVAPLLFVSAPAFAADTTDVCNGIGVVSGATGSTTGTGCADNSGKLDSVIHTVINVFSAIVGFMAVVMMIIGGLKYITSGGDTSKVSSAKNTILFALIGLAIAASAQVLVHFVLNSAACPSGQSLKSVNGASPVCTKN